MFSRRAEQQWPHHCNWNIFHSQPGDMQTQLLSLSRMRESPTGFILLAECGLWEQARGLEKTSSEIRSSFKMSLWIRETIKSRQRVVERSGYWDALLPFPVQLRDQKNSQDGGVTPGRHMILNTGLPEWRISLLEQIHIKSRRFYGIVACRSFMASQLAAV